MLRRFFALLLLLATVPAALVACGPQAPYTAVFYNKCNTDVSLTLYSAGSSLSPDALFAGCEDILDRAEAIFSRTDPTAELAAVNAATGDAVTLSPTLAGLLARALEGARVTGGAFDPTVGSLTALFDITGDTPLPDAAAVAAALATVGYEKITLDGLTLHRAPGTRLDMGAIAKGYLAAELVAYLSDAGVSGGVLSLGGNVATFGRKPDGSDFRVAVRSPFADGVATLGVLSVTGEGYVSTSGAYERFRVGPDGRIYHHIFDTATGYPADSDLTSVTVIDTDGARADMLSTALFVMGYEEAVRFLAAEGRAYEAVLVRADREIYATSGARFTPA